SQATGHSPDLPSFPTRRSSDLLATDLVGYRARGLGERDAPRGRGHDRKTEHSVNEPVTCGHPLIEAAIQRRIKGARRNVSFFRRSEEHTSELQSLRHLVCRLLL